MNKFWLSDRRPVVGEIRGLDGQRVRGKGLSEYRLYCFAQSGNAYKAALALTLAGVDWQPVFVDFFNGGTRTPEYRALNEMGEAPVLEHGDLRLTQSGVILDYLAATLRPLRPGDRGRAPRDPALDALGQPQVHLLHRHPALHDELRRRRGKRDPAVIAFLDARSRNAAQGPRRPPRATATGSPPTALTTADLSCIGYLYFTDEFGLDLAAFPNIDRWRSAIAALPGWQHPYDLMPGHPIPAGPDPRRPPCPTPTSTTRIRTPRGKGRPDGSLHEVTALRLSADTLNAIKARNDGAADDVEDVIWGNVTQVGEQGGCLARSAVLLSDLDQKVPGLVDQPLLRLRPRGGEPRRQPGPRRRGRRLHRRRRRDDVPGADGLRRRRHRRRPVAGDQELLRAAGHRRRHHRHRVRLLPRRLRRSSPSRARSAPPGPGRRTASPAR